MLMKVFMFILAAVVSYLICGVNFAVILSNLIYHSDIREQGSGNPGFTNFKRAYGNKYAWFVFFLDILKAVLPCIVFGILFGKLFDMRQIGAAYSGLFGILGHIFPCWYHFKGGKGFLVLLGTLWVVDWRAGAIATGVMVVLLLSTKLMSLATMTGVICGVASVAIFGPDSWWAVILLIPCVVLNVWRHKDNIKRLVAGTENKTYIFGKGKAK